MVNVELRHLRAFLVLAEELNFTKAATRLHVVQQALSAQIRQLEEALGVDLFARTTRRVSLTVAGEALRAHAPSVLRHLDDALDEVRQQAAGEGGPLALGLLATASLDFTPRLLRAFAAERPKAQVSIRNVAFDDPSGGVRDGRADVALVWRPFDDRSLACEPLFTDQRVAVLPVDHPLAAAPIVEAQALAGEPFVWVEAMDPVARDFWTLAEARGGRPRSVTGALPWADVTTRPVRGLAPAIVAACWRVDDSRPLVRAFVSCARQLAEREADAASRASAGASPAEAMRQRRSPRRQ